MIGNTVRCLYCNSELFNENETITSFHTPSHRKFYIIIRLPQIWIHHLNSTARCAFCDAVIGVTITDFPDLIAIWNGKTENEEI